MNTESIDCRRVNTRDEVARPGDFFIATDGEDRRPGIRGSITLILPDSATITLPIEMGPNRPGQAWGWDGNIDRPTLAPSIHTFVHWHGYLRAGRLESC